MSILWSGFDKVDISIKIKEKVVMLGPTEESRYEPFNDLYEVKSNEVSTGSYGSTVYRKPSGITLVFRKNRVEISYGGNFFRDTNKPYPKLKKHIKELNKLFEGHIRLNRVDPALILKSKTGDPSDHLFFGKGSKISHKKNTTFMASKIYGVDDNNLASETIYLGNPMTQRMLIYRPSVEVKNSSDPVEKEYYLRKLLKKDYQSSIKAEIRSKNRSMLNKDSIQDLLNEDYQKIFSDLSQRFFSSFEVKTRNDKLTRSYIKLRKQFKSACPQF